MCFEKKYPGHPIRLKKVVNQINNREEELTNVIVIIQPQCMIHFNAFRIP